MGSEITTSEILLLINERDLHTQNKLVDILETLDKVCTHIAVSADREKADAEFKKEVRTHIKEAAPLLEYVKDQKAVTGKMKTAFFVAIMFAVFVLLGFNFK